MVSVAHKIKSNNHSLFHFFWPVAIFFVNFFHKWRYITQRDISLDEPFSIFQAHRPPFEIITELLAGNNPPLFELLLHYWMLLFGNNPASVRFLPLIFSSLAAAILFRFAHKFFSWYAGIFAALLFTFNTFHYFFALETRVYSLLALLTAVSIYSFVSLYKKPGCTKYLVLLTLSNILLGHAHYFGLLIIFAEVVLAIGLLSVKEKKFTKQVLISMGIFTLLYLPILINLYSRYTSTVQAGTWNTPPSGIREFFMHASGFFNGINPLEQFITVMLVALAIVLIYWWLHPIRPKINVQQTLIALLLLLLFLIPYALMFIGSYKTPMFIIRYTLFTSIPLYLFSAALLHLLFARNLIIYTVVVVIGVFYFTRSLEINPDYFYQREVKSAVEKVKEFRMGQQSTPIVIHPHFTYFGFLYYYDRTLFNQPHKLDSNLRALNIYPIWNYDEIMHIVEEQKPGSIIYYQDGSHADDAKAHIYNKYDSIYFADTTFFYPQTFYITRFSKK